MTMLINLPLGGGLRNTTHFQYLSCPALTCFQWLPKLATSQLPNLGRALRASWSPGRGYPHLRFAITVWLFDKFLPWRCLPRFLTEPAKTRDGYSVGLDA